MQTFRTFVAVPLPPKLQKDLGRLIQHHACDGDGVKWVPPEICQMTLKFLGEVDNVDSAAVCDVAAEAVADVDSFDVTLTTTGALPSADRPRSLVVMVDDPSGRLQQIVAAMEDGYAAMGFRREPRDYVPHIALGRTRGGSRRISGEVTGRWLEDAPEVAIGEMRIDRVEVVASFLEKAGPSYQRLEVIGLGQEGGNYDYD